MVRRPSGRAFTLVELLVVIGIIALLIAILVPTLAAAKQHASRIKCASNLRTLGQISIQYAADNKGWLPHSYYYSNGGAVVQGGDPIGSLSWVDLLARSLRQTLPPPPARMLYTSAYDHLAAPYYLKIEWFKCPAYPDPKQPLDYLINGWGSTAAGGRFNLALIKTTSIRRSSEVVYFLEANKKRPLTEFNLHDVWEPSHLAGGGGVRIIDDQRHRGLTNICYADGHVAPRPFKSLKPADFVPPP